MLAVWRVHGFDVVLREAWERGILLCGTSAGMICWFEAGVTDSFGPQLEGMRDLLGFLPGSACPHYDGEERRRPVYRELVDAGFPPGYAADDDAALYFVGTELREAVSLREGTQVRIASSPVGRRRSRHGSSRETRRGDLHRERQREDDRRLGIGRGSVSRIYELDALHHGPNWAEPTLEEFRARVEPVVRVGVLGDRRRVPRKARRSRARAEPIIVVWLDLPLHVWLPRLVRRTARRVIQPRGTLDGNRERLRDVAASDRTPSSSMRFATTGDRGDVRRGARTLSTRAPSHSAVRWTTSSRTPARPELREPRLQHAVRARSGSGARRRRDRRGSIRNHQNAILGNGSQPFSRRSPLPPGGGRNGCRSGTCPGAPYGFGSLSFIRGRRACASRRGGGCALRSPRPRARTRR